LSFGKVGNVWRGTLDGKGKQTLRESRDLVGPRR
jgi:hypothetical protein